MTPSGPLNVTAEDRLWSRVEQFVESKHRNLHGRVDRCEMEQSKLETLVTEHYVSKESLKYQLENIEDRYEPIRTSLTWLTRLIVAGFIGAMAQYVYIHVK